MDSVQCYGVLLQHRDQFHHCCDVTIQNMVEDERESRVLMENVISLYFIERYLIKIACYIFKENNYKFCLVVFSLNMIKFIYN